MTEGVVPLHAHTSQPLAEEIGCLDFHKSGGGGEKTKTKTKKKEKKKKPVLGDSC